MTPRHLLPIRHLLAVCKDGRLTGRELPPSQVEAITAALAALQQGVAAMNPATQKAVRTVRLLVAPTLSREACGQITREAPRVIAAAEMLWGRV